jgi:RNA polymerase sigma-70 factor (ECF subfamily)
LSETFLTTLGAARTGAEWAWTVIYRDLAPSVLRYLRARGAREPEQLLGDVFLDVVRALPRFEGGHAEFRTWVFTIAHHRLVDDLRRRRRQPCVSAVTETLAEAAGSGDCEDDAVRLLEGVEVRRVLERLSWGDRLERARTPHERGDGPAAGARSAAGRRRLHRVGLDADG